MNKEFKKIKRRYLAEAIVKSVICGVALGLFAVGAVLLGLKLAEIQINAGFYALIGAVPALLAGVAAFFVLRPTDAKAAKATDEKYGLNERTQTMVAYYGKQGEILELQREDAAEKLAALPREKFDIKKFWQYALIFVLAVALFVTSIVLPVKAETEPPNPQVPFTFTERQQDALKSLIEEVKTSNLTEEDASSASGMLEVLYTTLLGVEYVSEMKEAVVSSISFIDNILYTSNTFDNIAYYLNKPKTTEVDGEEVTDESLAPLALAITGGVTYYKAAAMPIISIERVRDEEKDFENKIGDELTKNLDVFLKVYEVTIEDGLPAKISDLNERITEGGAADGVSAEDLIRVALDKFVTDMNAVAGKISEGMSDSRVQPEIKSAVSAMRFELIGALIPQTYKCVMDEFIRQRLANIFSISSTELPRLKSGVKDIDDNGNDDDESTNPGGIGPGEHVFGSNETIYHPDVGEIVKYGEYLSEYYAKMVEQLNSSGLPENVQAQILDYFNKLYAGINDNSQNENK